MEEKRINALMKKALMETIGLEKIERQDTCPNEITLSSYMEGSLTKEEEKLIAEHVKGCYWCIEQMDQAQRLDAKEKPSPKSISRTSFISWIKKNKWLIGAIISFLLSFVFPRYFFQFLILTLLAGIKWIFTTAGTKTIIMIYDAFKRKGREETNSSKNRFSA